MVDVLIQDDFVVLWCKDSQPLLNIIFDMFFLTLFFLPRWDTKTGHRIINKTRGRSSRPWRRSWGTLGRRQIMSKWCHENTNTVLTSFSAGRALRAEHELPTTAASKKTPQYPPLHLDKDWLVCLRLEKQFIEHFLVKGELSRQRLRFLQEKRKRLFTLSNRVDSI